MDFSFYKVFGELETMFSSEIKSYPHLNIWILQKIKSIKPIIRMKSIQLALQVFDMVK